MTKEYLSNEELQQLIDETERAPLLAAPSYLKTEILDKADRLPFLPEPGKTAGRPMVPTSLSFVFYSLKVGFAVAAAVLMLVYVPLGRGENPIPEPKFRVESSGRFFSDFTSAVNRKTNAFCNYLSDITNRRF